MVYEREQIDLAMCGVRLLPIVALVAIGSYVARSRIAFLLGLAGAFIGLIVPARIVYAQYSGVDAAYMGSLADSANHVLFYGIIGASIGWGLGIYLAVKRRTMTNGTNLHGETTGSEHLANETPCDANMSQPQGGSPLGREGQGKMVE